MYEKHMQQYVGHIQDYVWVVYRKTSEHFIYNNILVIYGLYRHYMAICGILNKEYYFSRKVVIRHDCMWK